MINQKFQKRYSFSLKYKREPEISGLAVKELRKLFNNYVVAREKAEQQYSTGNMEATGNSNESIVNSAEMLMVVAQAVGGKEEKKKFSTNCRFCVELHWSDECTKYNTAKTRKQRIKGSCYICLKQGHIANDCPKRISCFHCGTMNHHHRSLCTQKFGTVYREQANLAEEQSSQDEVLNTENSMISSGEMVLMQTAKADINNPDSGFEQNTHMLLDSGSQRTCITESLARKMNLETGKREEITLVTFGSETPQKI